MVRYGVEDPTRDVRMIPRHENHIDNRLGRVHIQIEQGVDERKGSSRKEHFPLVFPLKGTKSLQPWLS